jgi:hypothetical protein
MAFAEVEQRSSHIDEAQLRVVLVRDRAKK